MWGTCRDEVLEHARIHKNHLRRIPMEQPAGGKTVETEIKSGETKNKTLNGKAILARKSQAFYNFFNLRLLYALMLGLLFNII